MLLLFFAATFTFTKAKSNSIATLVSELSVDGEWTSAKKYWHGWSCDYLALEKFGCNNLSIKNERLSDGKALRTRLI